MSNSTIEHLLKRRSVSANALGDPGPDRAQLEQILTAAARVPDHKKLAPWRFILFEGEARDAFGRVLAEVCREEEPEPSAIRLETEAKRFLRAPVVIAVISRVRTNVPVPEWEQVLSAGAACQNMVLAASALGFGVNWITEWYAFSGGVRRALGLEENERVAGFIYIGTAKEKPEERPRPALEEHHAKIVLKRLDRLRHRGLRDRQRPRRARNAAALGRGDEELQLSKGEGQGYLPFAP